MKFADIALGNGAKRRVQDAVLTFSRRTRRTAFVDPVKAKSGRCSASLSGFNGSHDTCSRCRLSNLVNQSIFSRGDSKAEALGENIHALIQAFTMDG
jgi:hypothetical protein